jgi:coenzyme PQQ precursor peptide PqqA
MWVPGPEVAENEPRLYPPAKGPVSACEPGDARRVGFANAVLGDRILITVSFPETTMWTKPEFTEMRFGFEVTMYIANR